VRRLVAAAVGALLLAGVGAATSGAEPACGARTLVLSAMPLELNPLVEAAAITSTADVDGRTYYGATLAGRDVVLTVTGIGPVNAAHAITTAVEHSSCPFTAAVFSGVAGSRSSIGDVVVPVRWTLDDGAHWFPADPALVAVARTVRPTLSRDVPVGDAACLCPGVDAATPVHVGHVPVVRVGGDGTTSDPFGGKAVPCVPGGGDIAGCRPCVLAGIGADVLDFARTPPELPTFAAPGPTTDTYAAQDEETAAVAQVAERHGIPFLGIRGVSDGQGDPLHLPGFPAQFLVYRQLAADNAAATTIEVLRRLG
jgi:nucleoside phosphorylase